MVVTVVVVDFLADEVNVADECGAQLEEDPLPLRLLSVLLQLLSQRVHR